MKSFLMTFLMTMVLLVAGTAFAFNVPTPTGYVTDTTGKLSASQVKQLDQRLTEYSQRTKNEIAVVLVPSLGGENLEDVTHQVFQTYKVGKAGLDNGVLLFVAVNDRKMRLQTGKGVEGDLTDIQSKAILDSMKPSFRSGDFAGGVNKAVDQIQVKLDSRSGQKVDPGQGQQFNQPVPSSPQTESSTPRSSGCQISSVGNEAGFSLGFLAALIGGIALTRRYIRRREQRKMDALEAQAEAELEAERRAAIEEKNREARQVKHQEMLRAEREAELERNKLRAAQDAERVSKARIEEASRKANMPRAVSVQVVDPLPAARKVSPSRVTPASTTHPAAVAEEARRVEVRREEERAAARRRDQEDADRRRRERDEDDRRRKREEDDRSSSSSSSSSSWGGSSSDSGFGGGDSGGGGGSSDW